MKQLILLFTIFFSFNSYSQNLEYRSVDYYFDIVEKNEIEELKKEKIVLSNEFIKTNKERIKTEVDGLYEFIIKTQEETENKLKICM